MNRGPRLPKHHLEGYLTKKLDNKENNYNKKLITIKMFVGAHLVVFKLTFCSGVMPGGICGPYVLPVLKFGLALCKASVLSIV